MGFDVCAHAVGTAQQSQGRDAIMTRAVVPAPMISAGNRNRSRVCPRIQLRDRTEIRKRTKQGKVERTSGKMMLVFYSGCNGNPQLPFFRAKFVIPLCCASVPLKPVPFLSTITKF